MGESLGALIALTALIDVLISDIGGVIMTGAALAVACRSCSIAVISVFQANFCSISQCQTKI